MAKGQPGKGTTRGAARPARQAPGVPDAFVWAGLALAVLILALHVAMYAFLTDDSFISFRYARNLANGHGLVFNPGWERVEGYTNLLWVLLLAGFMALGSNPEWMSHVLSYAATAALFALVVRFAWVRAGPGEKWVALLPAIFLALTRSFAVWASSGLETRLFELLVVAGLLRLVREVEGTGPGERPPRLLSPWLFGLAALTRPDGVLVGGCALLASFAYQRWKTGRIPWAHTLAWWPMAALVGAHLTFRLLYYGDWFPNTYYAKVGGHLSWGAGARYLAMFALEYGALLWIPCLAAAVLWHMRKGTLFVPLLFGAVVLPHALYIVAIGGDHFEYRPLDLYLPLIFLLIANGALAWASSRAGALLTAGYTALIVFGLTWFPLRTHFEFPMVYQPGFPGTYEDKLDDADRFLATEHDPVFHLPVLRLILRAYSDLVREQTHNFGAIRQEEHRMFLEKADASARRLVGHLARGTLPRDLHVAVDCVGVMPYRTDWRVLDRLGLTDAHVARTPFVSTAIAHGKYATMEYAQERGVDLWSADAVSPACSLGSDRIERGIRTALSEGGEHYAAELGSADYLFCKLPLGVESAARRMPGIAFRPAADPTLVANYLGRVLPGFLSDLERGSDDPNRSRLLWEVCVLAGDMPSAGRIFALASARWKHNWQFFWTLAVSQKLSGDAQGADVSLGRAISMLQEKGDADAGTRLTGLLRQIPLGKSMPK